VTGLFPYPAESAAFFLREVLRLSKGFADPSKLSSVLPPPALAEVLLLLHGGHLTLSGSAQLLERMLVSPESPHTLARRMGLYCTTDSEAWNAAARELVFREAEAVRCYRMGKTKVAKYLLGILIREIGPQADPKALAAILDKALNEVSDLPLKDKEKPPV